MTTKEFLSIALAALAMLAVSTATMTLTACGDDDDDKGKTDNTVSIYKQWEWVDAPSDAASLVYDFSEQGKVKLLVKYLAEDAADRGLSADKYYIVEEGSYTITMNSDGKSGTILVGESTLTFEDLTATTVTIIDIGGYEHPCKAVSKKIVGEPMPDMK